MEKIDLLKLLIYLLVLMVIAFFMILFVIIPNIKEYRTSQTIYKRAFVYKMRVESTLNDRNSENSNLKKEHKYILTAFTHKFSIDSFTKYANKFFTNISIVEVNKKKYKKEFIEYELKISSNLKNPTNFYRFLEGLNRYENIIQADFPIYIESKPNKMSSSFNIKVYELDSIK
ncbi:MAG: hypothetical protein JJV95_05330 [Sulfurospirillum sp.]|nr:hypothetical protein [Sulfurospirillum sp.]MBL0703387.1 hypothetical protein [Sulfurospirillum sp.]